MNVKLNTILAGLFIALMAVACGDTSQTGNDNGEAQEAQQEEATQMQDEGHDHEHHDHAEDMEGAAGPEYTSRYICPMHCEGSGSAEPGLCPVCGMDYVLNEDFKGADSLNMEKDGHEGHDHEGHGHEGHEH